ncbi:DUF4870 domain-containing protein [Flavobacterium alvei]|uniref:DUF4870 domain-containing protein n=1 Tax=Flavobacterium alvei TaxID=2080416 RepID=UPI0026EF3404|nr:DUF4870 domain-containing protein [Flavobacterium alvei]
METTSNKNLATFTHLSTLSQYFIPFGNYIFPILIWSSNKDKSEFINYTGKQVINFQLSVFLYSLILAVIAIPILIVTIFSNVSLNTVFYEENFMRNNFSIENISGIAIIAIIALLLFVGLKVAEFFLIIYASVKTSNGDQFKYPLTIPFIK